jgi:large subunit ribosomal protein L24
MKPTTIRNKTIYNASHVVRSKLLCSHLSKDLQNKYNKSSIRVTEGDTVRVMRGEYKGVTGKITKVSTNDHGVSIEGIKREKLKGGNVDVFIHASNLLVTDLNTEDSWRQNKLEGKKPKLAKEKEKTTSKETKEKEVPKETKQQKEAKPQSKEEKPKETKSVSKENKESKIAKKPKKENKQ